MLIYVMGWSLEYYDSCAIDECMEYMNFCGKWFSVLIEFIVQFDVFMKWGCVE